MGQEATVETPLFAADFGLGIRMMALYCATQAVYSLHFSGSDSREAMLLQRYLSNKGLTAELQGGATSANVMTRREDERAVASVLALFEKEMRVLLREVSGRTVVEIVDPARHIKPNDRKSLSKFAAEFERGSLIRSSLDPFLASPLNRNKRLVRYSYVVRPWLSESNLATHAIAGSFELLSSGGCREVYHFCCEQTPR